MIPQIITLNDGGQWRRLGKYIPAGYSKSMGDHPPLIYEDIQWYDPKRGGWPMNYAVWAWARETLPERDRATLFYVNDWRASQCWFTTWSAWEQHMRRGMTGNFGQNMVLALQHWTRCEKPKLPWIIDTVEENFVRLYPTPMPPDLGRAPQVTPEDRAAIQSEVDVLVRERGLLIWSSRPDDVERSRQIERRLRELFTKARPGMKDTTVTSRFNTWLTKGGPFLPKERTWDADTETGQPAAPA